ncbi:MAG: hypothetical protein PHU25_06595 [Deltaproteobacteria bacterium]|nr:hypothetical protein [Deltaproteobacteria bacterium]
MSDAEKYRARLEQDPTDTQAFVSLCDIAERGGDYEYLGELYIYRAQVIKDDQEVGDLYFRAGEVYLDKLGDVTRGVEVLLKGFEHDRTHAGIGDRLDAIYRGAEDWEATIQIMEQRLEALAQSDVNDTKVTIRSDLHQQAGEIWEKALSDADRALGHYRKAIELDKTNLLALYAAREIYYAAGKYKNAAKLCELEARVEKDLERRIALYRELAHILSENLADAPQAVLALKRALKLSPESEDIKLDLARAIAGTPATPDTQKDHRWASEYLLRAAKDASPEENLQLARLAVLAMPENARAMEFIEARAREQGAPEDLAAAYQQIIDAIPDLAGKAPMIRRLAKIYVEEIGSPEQALRMFKSIESLGYEEDRRAIEQLSKGVRVRASQAPPPPPGPIGQAAAARPVKAAASMASLDFDDEEAVEEVAEKRPAPVPAPAKAVHGPAHPPDGKSTEEYVQELHAMAEKARRAGDDATAEERMLSVIEMSPYDQKATTYLERRFRARGDWASLRDLLLRSAGAPHLPPPVQTVRLREAARLSEEQLSDLNGAIEAWKAIQEHDPKVRDAADALVRLYGQSERWHDLLAIIKQEAETTKSRQKRIDAYRRMAEIHRIRLSDVGAASEAYKNVLDLAPDDVEALEALDEIYLREQHYEELVPLLKKRAELSRERGDRRNFLLRAAVTLRDRLDRPEDAYAIAKDIRSIMPDDDEVLELMEAIDEESENWKRLVDVLDFRAKAAADLELKSVLLRKKAVVAAHRLQDAPRAARAWHEVLDAIPGDIEALDALVDLHRSAGQWGEMVDVLRLKLKTLKTANDRAEVHRQIARTLEDELNQPDAAMESWRLVLEAGEDVESLGALSRYYERISDWSEFEGVLLRQAPHAADHVERADILFKRASILREKLGERDKARDALRQILGEVDPTHLPTLALLRDVLVESGDHKGAAEILEQQIAHTEDRGQLKELLTTLGDWSKNELKDLERAMDAYERAVQIEAGDGKLLDVLDEVYTALSEWDKLLKLLWDRSLGTKEDGERLALLLRGGKLCEEEVKDATKVWPWYRQAFDVLRHVDETIPAVEEAAHRMGLWRELIDIYGVMTRTAEGKEEQASWWRKVSRIFEDKLNEPAQALEATLRAFGLDPDNKDLLDSVDRLGVAASNWQRLATVYGVLVGRETDKGGKIALLRRYTDVLAEKAHRASDAFDVSVKALELEPTNDELLAVVERVGIEAERWNELVKVYAVSADLSEDKERKIDLKLRAATMLRDKLDNGDGALAMALDVVRLEPFSEEGATGKAWEVVRSLEDGLLTTEKGVYWSKLIELYRELVTDNRHERENQVDLLIVIARIYADEIKDVGAAFECLKEAQQIDPRSEATIDKLEAIARKYNFWEGVSDHYADILDETFEMDVAVMYHRRRARILEQELDRADEASEHYWQIIQLDANDQVGYTKLLAFYERTARWNELVNLLERQLDNTQDPDRKREILLQIAGVWEQKIKNRYEARDWYKQVLTSWPDSDEAKAGLARLSVGKGAGKVVEEDEEDDELKDLISIPPPTKPDVAEPEAENVAEPGHEKEPEPEAEPEAEPEPEVESEPEPEAEPEAVPEPEAEPEAVPEPEAEPEAVPEPGAEPEPEPEKEPEPDADEEPSIESGGELHSFLDPAPPEGEAAAAEEAKPDLDLEPDVEQEADEISADDLVVGEETLLDGDIEEIDADLLDEVEEDKS